MNLATLKLPEITYGVMSSKGSLWGGRKDVDAWVKVPTPYTIANKFPPREFIGLITGASDEVAGMELARAELFRRMRISVSDFWRNMSDMPVGLDGEREYLLVVLDALMEAHPVE